MFDESQPRDELGRWTDGGGTSASKEAYQTGAKGHLRTTDAGRVAMEAGERAYQTGSAQDHHEAARLHRVAAKDRRAKALNDPENADAHLQAAKEHDSLAHNHGERAFKAKRREAGQQFGGPADQASEKANAATIRAHATGSAEDHRSAAQAHLDAARENQAEALRRGASGIANEYQNRANKHNNLAAQHNEIVGKIDRAVSSSGAAAEASARAEKIGTEQAHLDAAKAHDRAAVANVEVNRLNKAMEHQNIASEHRSKATKLNHDAQTPVEPKETIARTDVPVGRRSFPPALDPGGKFQQISIGKIKVEGTAHRQAQETVDRLYNNHPDVVNMLEQKNLGALRFAPPGSMIFKKFGMNNAGTMAFYNYGSRLVVVSDGSIKKQFEFGGVTHNAGFNHSDEALRREAVLIHEIGHHIDHVFVGRSISITRAADAAYANANSSKSHVSQYAKVNRMEYFAETFAAYHMTPDKLLQRDPQGHALIKSVMEKWRKK